MVERALVHGIGTQTAASISEDLTTGPAQLWVRWSLSRGVESCCVTRVMDYPAKRLLEIVLYAGRGALRHLSEYHRQVVPWARSVGCSAMRQSGRDGWMRALSRYGWRMGRVEMLMDLTDGE